MSDILCFTGAINDVFVGLITLCVTITLETFMGQTSGSQWKIGGVKLGGYNGLSKIPMLQIGGFTFDAMMFYYFVLILVLIIYLILRHTQKSGTGYSLIAIRENRQRSELFGYNIRLVQTLVFAAGGALAGISGSQYALIILGGFLILVILFVPEGLLAALFKKLDSLWKGGRENG